MLLANKGIAVMRLHGPAAGKYQGSYCEDKLQSWARQIEAWSRQLKAIYIYFDNDQAGYAACNALALRRIVFGRARLGKKYG